MVKITEGKRYAPTTQKAARGGGGKWKLDHLPDNSARTIFQTDFTPLVKFRVGATTDDPWQPLFRKEVQVLVDEVFDKGKYVVQDNDVWCGLVCNRRLLWHLLTLPM